TLLTLLDNNRTVMVWKLDGLTLEQANRPAVASGTSLLGLVKHLAFVERWWFDDFFAGNTVDYPWSEEDPDADFRIEEGETVESVISLYTEAVARSNRLVAEAHMDDLSVGSRGGERFALRWIVAHMIEETARHAGHADIVRELIDGTTGDYPE
ncbi:MAG: DinB family protein, partial [Phycisphaeraceae bacterium]|nr:DinB family protein [Phycisphaeraceae bacterium]